VIVDIFNTLALLAITLVILRFFGSVSRKEHLWFGVLLLAFFFRILFENSYPLRFSFSIVFVWAGGCYISFILGAKRTWLWHLSTLGVFITILIFSALGYHLKPAFNVFYIAAFGMLSAYPIWLIFLYFRQTQDYLFMYFFIVSIVWLLSSFYELIISLYGIPDYQLLYWTSILFIGGILYLLIEGGYLKGESMNGYSAKIDMKNRLVSSAYSQLVQTENTLRLQDRLAAMGLLASGSLHEIKNLLNTIGNSAQFGRREKSVKSKDRALELIAEHVKLGNETVSHLLEKIVFEGREEPKMVKPREDLKLLYRMLRVTYRVHDIRVIMDFPSDFTIYVRRGELEQVLLNMVRNAVESFERNGIVEEKIIRISGHVGEGTAIIDVEDNAGGIPEDLVPRIFEPAFSTSEGSGSRGLGLFLSRTLVERNGGSIEYIPGDNGSCFRLVFLER